MLQINDIDLNDNFYHIGGDSLLAIELSARIKETFSVAFPPSIFLEKSTINQQAEFILDKSVPN